MEQPADNKILIVVAGPTAVGKTVTAIRIARHFNAEIISADSRQFFREMNIGTAKPSPAELAAVRHHFINSHSITEAYDAAQFGEDAVKCIHQLFNDFNYVVMCGGSGLYIRAVIDGFDDIPAIDPRIREELTAEYQENGVEWLQKKMIELDPDHYAYIDQHNPHRLIRALEVKIGTGQSIATYRKNARRSHPFSVIRVGLELPREELFQRIDYRMDQMIGHGLFGEAQSLYQFRMHNALQTVGYQEIFDYIEGKFDKAEAIRLLKRNSRRYAKRQLTWFKRDPLMKWFHPDDFDNIADFIRSAVHQTDSSRD